MMKFRNLPPILLACLLAALLLGLPAALDAAKWRVRIPALGIDTVVEIDEIIEPTPDPDPLPPPDEPSDSGTPDPGPEPEPAPDPEPKPPAPPATGGANAYFDELAARPDHVASWSLRDPTGAQYAVKNVANSQISYDPDEDAAKVTLRVGQGYSLKMPIGFRHADTSKDSGFVYLTYCWEEKFDSTFINLTHDSALNGGTPFGNWKHLRCHGWRDYYDPAVKDTAPLMCEVQTRFSDAAPGTVGLPALRSYMNPAFYEQPSKPSDNINWLPPGARTSSMQPGRLPADYYYWPAGIWIRVWLEISFVDGQERWRLTISDEQHDPQVIVASPADPQLGFAVSPVEYKNVYQGIGLLDNTSTSQPNDIRDLTHWIRNVTVHRGNERIEPAGRPGKLKGE